MPLRIYRGRHFQCGVDSVGVVKMDRLVDSIYQFAEILKPVRISQINFKLRVKGFLEAILPRVGFPAHGRYYLINPQKINKLPAVVFASLVAVEIQRSLFSVFADAILTMSVVAKRTTSNTTIVFLI